MDWWADGWTDGRTDKKTDREETSYSDSDSIAHCTHSVSTSQYPQCQHISVLRVSTHQCTHSVNTSVYPGCQHISVPTVSTHHCTHSVNTTTFSTVSTHHCTHNVNPSASPTSHCHHSVNTSVSQPSRCSTNSISPYPAVHTGLTAVQQRDPDRLSHQLLSRTEIPRTSGHRDDLF